MHCVAGSHGAAFDARFDRTHVDVIVDKGVDPATDGYAAASRRPRSPTICARTVSRRVFICGLATDYCVKATALDARAAGFAAVVVADAAAAVNVQAGDEERALDELRAAGVTIAQSAELLT